MNRLLLLLLLVIESISLKAQSPYYGFNESCQKAYENLLLLKFDSADFYIQKEKKENPDNLIPLLLDNYKDFLRIALYENEKYFEQHNDNGKERLKIWKTGPNNSPWYLSGQAQIKLQWAFCRVFFDEYFTAATEINSAYHLLEENKELFPDFINDNMGLGILHAMIGVVPDQYQWALELFGFYGTLEQGINEIFEQINARDSSVFKTEALFYYTFLKLNLENKPSRFDELLSLYNRAEFVDIIDQSPIVSLSKAVLLMRTNNDSAVEHLERSMSLYEASSFYYPVFLLGQAKLYQLDSDCEVYLEEYIKNYPGNNYKKTAYQRLAWWKLIQNNSKEYLMLMEKVRTEGNSILDSDKSALKEAHMAEEALLPNPVLLKSRILFDGHYYQSALDELNKINVVELSQEQLLEYHYRMGRIYHEMGGEDKAVQAYKMAVESGASSDRYFAGKAALKTGEIEENRGNPDQAKAAYEKCLELDFTEYRRGIRAKAKAGLQRIKSQSSI